MSPKFAQQEDVIEAQIGIDEVLVYSPPGLDENTKTGK